MLVLGMSPAEAFGCLCPERIAAHACVDTTGVAAGDVPGLVRAACQDWPGFTGRLEEANGQFSVQPGPAIGGRVALITGPVGVGKSTTGPVGRRRRGRRHDQPLAGRVGRHNPRCHRLALATLMTKTQGCNRALRDCAGSRLRPPLRLLTSWVSPLAS